MGFEIDFISGELSFRAKLRTTWLNKTLRAYGCVKMDTEILPI